MKLALKLLAAVLAGFGLHVFYRPTLVLGERWGTLARYALGCLGLLPFLLLVHHQMGEVKDEDERLAVSYLMTVGAMGTGTFLGHLWDRFGGGDQDYD